MHIVHSKYLLVFENVMCINIYKPSLPSPTNEKPKIKNDFHNLSPTEWFSQTTSFEAASNSWRLALKFGPAFEFYTSRVVNRISINL